MNTNINNEEISTDREEKPGLQLARIRQGKGLSQEYVAGKLHLRVRIIELLEADNYQLLPEPVFIKGYLRAYAKLLGVASEPLLVRFDHHHQPDKRMEKALWQSKKETNKTKSAVRWSTALLALIAIAMVGLWWQKANEIEEPLLVEKKPNPKVETAKMDSNDKLTHISKMQSLFSTITPVQLEIERG
jgi:cytoskeleton protein RodZ